MSGMGVTWTLTWSHSHSHMGVTHTRVSLGGHGVRGEREGVGSRYASVPHLLVMGGECWKGVHLHPTSQALDTQIPSPGAPGGTSRPATYSQNSMTGDVTFSDGPVVPAAEWFRKSMQWSVGDQGVSAVGQVGRDALTSCPPPSGLLAPSFPALGSPRFPVSGVPPWEAQGTSPLSHRICSRRI